MVHNFSLETCIVENRVLEGYPGSTRKAFSTFAEAKFACSKGIPSIYYVVGRTIHYNFFTILDKHCENSSIEI